MDTMEELVWQRVQAPPEPGRQDYRTLILPAQELAAVYRQRLRGASGREKELLGQLYEGERASIACLRGMEVLSGAGMRKVFAIPGKESPGAKVLEACYHQTRRAVTEYTARSAEPEFGSVFRILAQRAETRCALLLELLGQVQR